MVKRILFILLLTNSLAFASPFVSGTDSGLKAEASIVWDLSSTSYFSVWFGDNQNVTMDHARETAVSFKDSNQKKLYLYYEISSNKPTKIEMYAASPMTSENGGSIDWKISWTPLVDDQKSIGITSGNSVGYGEPKTVVKYTSPINKKAGTVELSLTLEAVQDMDLVLGNNKYTSSICVLMEVV